MYIYCILLQCIYIYIYTYHEYPHTLRKPARAPSYLRASPYADIFPAESTPECPAAVISANFDRSESLLRASTLNGCRSLFPCCQCFGQ